MKIKAFLAGGRTDAGIDIGLLILRVCAGMSLFLKHGWEKLTGYSTMVQHFPDPIHIGAHAGLAYALLSDGICSILVVLGVATRPACLVILLNLLTAFFLVHHARFFADGHVELIWIYIAVFLALAVTGAGRFSIDARLNRR
jgi:putative oxidoreductase